MQQPSCSLALLPQGCPRVRSCKAAYALWQGLRALHQLWSVFCHAIEIVDGIWRSSVWKTCPGGKVDPGELQILFSLGLSRVLVKLLFLLCALAMQGTRLPCQDSKDWCNRSAVETLATAPVMHFRAFNLDLFHYFYWEVGVFSRNFWYIFLQSALISSSGLLCMVTCVA